LQQCFYTYFCQSECRYRWLQSFVRVSYPVIFFPGIKNRLGFPKKIPASFGDAEKATLQKSAKRYQQTKVLKLRYADQSQHYVIFFKTTQNIPACKILTSCQPHNANN
jgi:hypothetical protein